MFSLVRDRRSIPFLLAVAAIAAWLTLSLTTSPTKAVAVPIYTRAVSCVGINFTPMSSATTLIHADAGITRTESGGDGFVSCNPGLPHKAEVMKVQFTALGQPGAGIQNCALVRTSNAPADALFALQVMAGVAPLNSGDVQRRSTTAISNPTVNNINFSYFLQCQLPTLTLPPSILLSADVVFEISETNG
jgi:hypothetical protein